MAFRPAYPYILYSCFICFVDQMYLTTFSTPHEVGILNINEYISWIIAPEWHVIRF